MAPLSQRSRPPAAPVAAGGDTIDLSSITGLDYSFLAPIHGLQELSLAGSGLSDDGIKHLASLTNLESLDLRGTKVTAAGITPCSGSYCCSLSIERNRPCAKT